MIKRLIVVALIIGLTLCIGSVLLLNAIANFLEPETKWTLQAVNALFDVDVPNTASNINIDGGRTRTFTSLDLSFDAPFEAEALRFTKQFCDGVLHTGYDPFNTSTDILKYDFETSTPPPNSVLITMQGKRASFSYFSVSSNIPDTIMGNRCMWSQSPIHIRIDKHNPLSVKVRLHMFNVCGESCSPEGIFQNNSSIH